MLTPEDIEGLRGKIEKYRIQGRSENFIRRKVIDPVLETLGWDDDDEVLVKEEYPVKGVGRVDYALLGKAKKPAVLVEAKKLGGASPDSWGSRKLKIYTENHINENGAEGYSFSVLTDGDAWLFYPAGYEQDPYLGDDDAPDVPSYRLIFKLSETSSSECAEQLTRLLEHSNVSSGNSKRELERLPEPKVLVEAKRKQKQKHGTRSMFRVNYKGRVMERGKQEGKETLLEVLNLLIADYGADDFIAACKRMEWKAASSFEEVKADKRTKPEQWQKVSDNYWLCLHLKNTDKKEHLDKLALELDLEDQLKATVIETAKDKQLDASSEAPRRKLQVKYNGQPIMEPSKHKTIFEVLSRIYKDVGEDEFIKAYQTMNWRILTEKQVSLKNNAYEWMAIADDRYVYTGWLKASLARYFDKLAEAFEIEGGIPFSFAKAGG